MNETARQKYLREAFGDNPQRERMQARALKYAHEIRRFEIDLFWKRSAYFWVFIALAFVAYAGLVKSQNGLVLWVASVALSSVGLILSFWWWLANKGSRYWQEIWEKNIDFLEDEITGKLYKTSIHEYTGSNSLLSASPFSVSKIGIAVSLLSTVIWSVLLVFSLMCFDPGCVPYRWWIVGSILVATVMVLWLSWKHLESDHAQEGDEIPLDSDSGYYIRRR